MEAFVVSLHVLFCWCICRSGDGSGGEGSQKQIPPAHTGMPGKLSFKVGGNFEGDG